MSSGIVRKVDELGRVVIPKEMRRVLNIQVGSSIEMLIDENYNVVLKKFSEMKNILNFAQSLGQTIFDYLKLKCLICDTEKIVSINGLNKKNYSLLKIKPNNIKDVREVLMNEFFDTENDEKIALFPIICDGVVIGYIIIFDEISDRVKDNIVLLSQLFINIFKSL